MENLNHEHIRKHWKYITTVANKYLKESLFEESLIEYQNALELAECLNDSQLINNYNDIRNIQVYIISCINISDAYIILGRLDQADKMLKRALFYLLHLIDENGNSSRYACKISIFCLLRIL